MRCLERIGGWRVARSRLCLSCGGVESLSAWCARGDGAQQKGKQQKGKGKATGGAGGGPSNKAAAAGSSSGEASTSRGEGSRPSTLPSASAGIHTTVEDAVQAVPPSAEAASGTQQPAGGGKKEKERQRKERQRQRRMNEAREALQAAMEAMALGSRCVRPLWFCAMHWQVPSVSLGAGSVYMAGRVHSRVAVRVVAAVRVRWPRWRRRRRRR
jgi:hypothetical protein